MSSRVRVGTVGFPVRDKRRVLAAVDIVELTDGRFEPPGRAAATRFKRSWPASVDAAVQCSVHLADPPRGDASLPGDPRGYGGFETSEENVALWGRCAEYAAAVEARALVVITPPSFTPGPSNLARMAAFFAAVDRRGLAVVWEPHGPWENRRAAAHAAEMGITLAVDPLRDPAPEGDAAYFRLGPFAAMGSRLGVYDLERLADAAAPFAEVTCVLDTPRALDDVRNLKAVLAGAEVEDTGDDDGVDGEDDGPDAED
jgi:uncharacterized protein YecE (DUF72 family)